VAVHERGLAGALNEGRTVGLFDEIVFEEHVTGLPAGCRHFQTKSLDNSMDYYVVTKTGRLCFVGNGFADGSVES
jgi:hypothetical protein